MDKNKTPHLARGCHALVSIETVSILFGIEDDGMKDRHRKARIALRQLEQGASSRILVPIAGEPERPRSMRYAVSLAALRKRLPELFEVEDARVDDEQAPDAERKADVGAEARKLAAQLEAERIAHKAARAELAALRAGIDSLLGKSTGGGQ